MKRHKRTLFEKTDDGNLNKVIIIIRKPKQTSYIRKRMYWAWNYKWDCQMYKKFN